MKHTILLALLCFSFFSSHAQGMYGFEAGLGKATLGKSKLTPTLRGYYLKKLSRRIYAGGGISWERYSFNHYINPGNAAYGDALSIRQKSSYVFFTPKIDLGIGYRQYVHLSLSFGPGVFAGGSKFTNQYDPLLNSSGQYYGGDTATYDNTGNIKTLICRFGLGVSERIPTQGHWNITLTQEFGYIPSKLNFPGTDIKSNYFCLTVGIMHKYPMVFVEY